MLRSIRLKNFRSLRDTGEVDLRPIVLLVGANSSGKSSFLRFFPLLRQTEEGNSHSPLLWYSEQGYVDFGDFETTRFRGAVDPKIEVSGVFMPSAAEDDDALAAPTKIQNLEDGRTWRFTSRIVRGASRSHVGEFQIERCGDTALLQIDHDGALTSLRVNKTEFSSSPDPNAVLLGRLVPQLAPGLAYTEAVVQRLRAKIDQVAHGRSTPAKLDAIADSITHGQAGQVLRSMRSVKGIGGVKKWLENIASMDPSSVYVNTIKELVFARDFRFQLDALSSAWRDMARRIRYIGPFRTTPQRFYRKEEVSVGEITQEGSNLAMFLHSLEAPKSSEFSGWVQQHFGFGVTAKVEGSHVVLRILPDSATRRDFNLVDMGFGISQLLPVIAQCWIASQDLPRARTIAFSPPPSILAIEQPELHLHPFHQSKLADMFAALMKAARDSRNNVPLFIETHSEAMLYRFGELVESGELRRQDISILLFEKQAGSDESSVRQIEFGDDGVLQDWPIGFFRG